MFGYLGETSEIRDSSNFHALAKHTLCCSSGLDRRSYKNIATFLVICPLVMSLDSFFGFILMVEENMSA